MKKNHHHRHVLCCSMSCSPHHHHRSRRKKKKEEGNHPTIIPQLVPPITNQTLMLSHVNTIVKYEYTTQKTKNTPLAHHSHTILLTLPQVRVRLTSFTAYGIQRHFGNFCHTCELFRVGFPCLKKDRDQRQTQFLAVRHPALPSRRRPCPTTSTSCSRLLGAPSFHWYVCHKSVGTIPNAFWPVLWNQSILRNYCTKVKRPNMALTYIPTTSMPYLRVFSFLLL